MEILAAKRSSCASGRGYVPGKFDVVLRRNDEEWRGQFEGIAVNRHLPLLHTFQQGGLRFGRGAVNFIGKHDVGEDRAGAHLKFRSALIINRRAGNVGRKQIGRELNSFE